MRIGGTPFKGKEAKNVPKRGWSLGYVTDPRGGKNPCDESRVRDLSPVCSITQKNRTWFR